MKEKLKTLKNLPKITKLYLVFVGITFFVLIGVNLWLLMFSQFGSIYDEFGRVKILSTFIDKTAISYFNRLEENQSDLNEEELKNIIEKSLEDLIKEKGDTVLYTLNSDNFFNYKVLSKDSYMLCYGFLTDHYVRDRYKIITKDGVIENYGCCEDAFGSIPSWVKITRESGEKKNGKYLDCYKISFKDLEK